MENNDMEKRPVRIPLTNLVDWRRYRGLTQEQLAAKSELTRLTIYNLETGKVQANPVTVGKVARGLGISIEQLLAGPTASSSAAAGTSLEQGEKDGKDRRAVA